MQSGAAIMVDRSERSRLELLRNPDNPAEWTVTLDGRYLLGFSGDDAEQRAQEHLRELTVALEHRPPPTTTA